MKLHYSELDKGIRFIRLVGKLDAAGVKEIEVEFTGYCAGEAIRILVDLSEVDGLAVDGIRFLTLTAKSLAGRGGRMALLSPTTGVQAALEKAGIPSIIPTYSYHESAETVLLAT
ncbi:MAG: STAS domain-containing protein [Chloroflexota bacterium]